jgi:hypothetical protein
MIPNGGYEAASVIKLIRKTVKKPSPNSYAKPMAMTDRNTILILAEFAGKSTNSVD